MPSRADCVAVIPCLDERTGIAEVVTGVLPRVAEVLVIDDGSRDGTGDAARLAGARVIRNERSRGKGASLRTGLAEARLRGAIWAACLDGDGQHDPADLATMFATAERTAADLVVGQRSTRASSMPWSRRLANRWMSRVLGGLAGREFPDSQCGFRLVRLRRLPELALATDHFEIESEMLLSAVRAGWRVEFSEIRTFYGRETSKIRVVTDTWRWLKWLAANARDRSGGAAQDRSATSTIRQPN